MPLYEYECSACGERFEIIQKFSDAPLTACKLCGKGPVEKLLSSPAIQFKGEGWYITDYARKGKTDGAKKDGGKTGAAGKDGESKAPSESKPSDATKADSGSKATASKKD